MIEVKNVVVSYGRKKIIDDISFSAKPGEITCLLGINGVGKSTLLKAIAGLMPLKKGSVTINDMPISYKTNVLLSYIPDQCTMPGDFTVNKSLDFMSYYYSNWNQEKAENLCEFLKLDRTKKISQLSKGNVAKVNLVLGLSLTCDFVLMDEPFSGIDILSRERIIEALTSDFLEENQGIILTTHEIPEIEAVVDRVLFLDNGKIERDFYPEEMRLEGKSIVDVMKEVY